MECRVWGIILREHMTKYMEVKPTISIVIQLGNNGSCTRSSIICYKTTTTTTRGIPEPPFVATVKILTFSLVTCKALLCLELIYNSRFNKLQQTNVIRGSLKQNFLPKRLILKSPRRLQIHLDAVALESIRL